MPSLVILAAGMGSRYGGSKQFATFGPYQRLILDYTIYDAIKAGFGKVVCVIRKEIEPAFRETVMSTWQHKVDLRVVFQELDTLPDGLPAVPGRTKPWGTAHAVWMAEPEVQEPFAMVNADDFYGRDAITKTFEQLQRLDPHKSSAFIVGYKLENTLSPYGSVSRGRCLSDAQQRLIEIRELKSIEMVGSSIVYKDDGVEKELSPDDLVSMNLMGFSPVVFDLIRKRFAEFYHRLAAGSSEEFYIAHALTAMIEQGDPVMVIPTDSEWFGVTYSEDNAWVNSRLAALHESGVYPETF